MKLCIDALGCKNQAFYADKGKKIPETCAEHKKKGQVKMDARVCIVLDCIIKARFPDPRDEINAKNGEKIVLKYCAGHKNTYNMDSESMKIVLSIPKKEKNVIKKCEYPGCIIRATYGIKNSNCPIHCKTHKNLEYVITTSIVCIEKDCKTRANFIDTDNILKYCDKHKTVNCYNVRFKKDNETIIKENGESSYIINKLCNTSNCNKRAFFGIKNEKSAIFCETHKLPNHFDVRKRFCIDETCDTTASFVDRSDYPDSDSESDDMESDPEDCDPNNDYECDSYPDDCDSDHGDNCDNGCSSSNKIQKEVKKIPKYCSKHKTLTSYEPHRKKCLEPNCDTVPIFGDKNLRIPIYCKKHSPTDFIDVVNKTCDFSNCTKQCTFGVKNTRIPIRCYEHKLEDYVDVKDRQICIKNGCTIRASFNIKGNKKGIYCKTHKPAEYVNVVDKTCEFGDCDIKPCFGMKGEKTPTRCSKHKLEGFVDVVNDKCINPNCDVQPTYGNKDCRKATHCSTHKLEGQVVVVGDTCKRKDCYNTAIFGIEGSKRGIYCNEHKENFHVNIKNKRCIAKGCSKISTFGCLKDRKAIYCLNHCPDNFIDVKHKVCSYNSCNTRPSYNYLGYSVQFCATHKEIGMIVNPQKFCCKDLCKNRATKIDGNDFYCNFHETENSINIYNVCSICITTIVETDKYICNSCELVIKDGKTVKIKIKEQEVKRCLEENDIEIYSYDKPIKGNCSNKRPDFVIENDNIQHIIILEVDEYQHKRSNYTDSCEITRMKQIYNDFAIEESKILFIRYNPDVYKPSYGSVFTTINRLDLLSKYIKNYNFDNDRSGINIVYLFYDEFDNTNLIKHYLDPCKI